MCSQRSPHTFLRSAGAGAAPRWQRESVVSRGKKLIALTVVAFVALIVVGASYSGHHGDPTGTATGTASDVIASQGLQGDSVPASQVGIDALANEVGHLHVAVNFSWLLVTGFLV